ncbi:MAG: fused MFS/spermidine synthase [Vicinamibacterales bacterium]
MAPPWWFLVVYAMSGAAALVYEVAWTRLLTLSLGHGVAAASTVTAAFMGGLAIGAAVAGPASDRLGRAVAMRLYAGLEIAIALLALALPLGLSFLDPLLSRAYADGTPGLAFPLIRLVASLILVALPAVAMGATFPLVARWYVPSARWATRDAGALYAANTAGAALGALATGFALVPWLGLRGTTWVGVALNAIVAASAWWLANASIDEPAAAPAAQDAAPTSGRRRKGGTPVKREVVPRPWVAAWAMAASGFLSLALQIVWSRLLAQVLGPTSYAFSLVVATFILGLAVGAVVGRRLAVGSQQPAAGLTGAIALAVLAAVAAVWTIDFGLMTVAHAVAAPDATFASVLTRQVGLVALWLLPIALALGCVFPFALRTGIGPESALGADLGLIYALNTVGAIAGALAAGFLIIPALGLHDSLRWVGAGTAVAGLACLAAARPAGTARLAATAALLAALGASLGLPRWDRELFASGAYKYASSLTPEALQVALHAGRLVYYAEGATATVSVREGAGTTSLAIDGKVDASNSGDMLTQRLLAHVPLLLHPAPKRVAILGLGSGVTLGSALTHPIERADVLEISPEVAEASRFFDPENGGALRDPRTRLLLGDGRTHIRLTHEQYDAIISEPSNPWMAGIASLFTREFFAAAKARLAPGGVLCQWAHTYDISADDLKSIVATFAAVFPDGTLWLVGDGDVLLIGSNQPLAPQIAAIPERLAARDTARANLATVGVRDGFALTSLLVTDGPGIAAFAGGAPLQTDDHAPVEFTGPRTVFSRGGPDNAAALRALAAEHPVAVVTAARQAASSASWRDRGWMLLDASAAVPAWSDFATAVRMDPRDTRALEGLVRAGGATNRASETADVLRAAAAPPEHVEAQMALSRFLAATGAVADAAQVAFAAAERDPSNLAVLEQLASVVADAGDRERLLPIVSRMRAIAPTADATRYYSASLLFMEGRTELAVGEARALLAATPTHAKGHNLLGAALATLGRRDEARDAFLASIKADPRDPSTYTNLALLELEGGNAAAGLQRLAEALTLDPGSAAAREAFDRELARTPGP